MKKKSGANRIFLYVQTARKAQPCAARFNHKLCPKAKAAGEKADIYFCFMQHLYILLQITAKKTAGLSTRR